ncbi:MAG: phosphotransferase enzyme family protein [Chitinophagaceae bacterium]|jgi:thiamine kinase-like enzyme
MDLHRILNQFLPDEKNAVISPLGVGLIHTTYGVGSSNQMRYVLQQINTDVFRNPEAIASNLEKLVNHSESIDQDPCFPIPLTTVSGSNYAMGENREYFRLTPYVPDSHAISVCSSPDEAYEAAFQFGRFSSSYASFDSLQLKDTISGFHDLNFRWQQFNDALKNGDQKRLTATRDLLQQIVDQNTILDRYNYIIQSTGFKKRVSHHDTKISNVLFSSNRKGMCVIDMDTTMSGYFISDLGDMFRTYLSPGNEEETDLEKVHVRRDFYSAILDGYNEKMADLLSEKEREALHYAGEFMIWMQALRFMTDYLMGDVYYGINYEENNLNRVINQMHLLNHFQQAN